MLRGEGGQHEGRGAVCQAAGGADEVVVSGGGFCIPARKELPEGLMLKQGRIGQLTYGGESIMRFQILLMIDTRASSKRN